MENIDAVREHVISIRLGDIMKKYVVLIVPFIIIIVGVVLLVVNSNSIYSTNATKEEMIKYNDIISNKYYRYYNDFDTKYNANDKSLMISILYTNKNKYNVLNDEGKHKIGVDYSNKVYIYSKTKLYSEVLNMYGTELQFNMIETSIKGDILVFDEKNIYYSIPKNEYIYFIKEINNKNNKIYLTILEYKYDSKNKKELYDYLNKGKIPNKYKYTNKYKMIFNSNDKLISKDTL